MTVFDLFTKPVSTSTNDIYLYDFQYNMILSHALVIISLVSSTIDRFFSVYMRKGHRNKWMRSKDWKNDRMSGCLCDDTIDRYRIILERLIYQCSIGISPYGTW